MGKASFGGSQDLSSLFASISGSGGGGSSAPAAKPKTTTTKTYTVKPVKLAPATYSIRNDGPTEAQQLQDQLDELGYELTTNQIDAFTYADQLESLANSTGDSGTRAKLLENAYVTRENAKVAKDKDMQTAYEAGEISDEEWISYIKDRADTEEDPEKLDQLKQTLKSEVGRISDTQAEMKYENGGRIEDLIAHYQSRLATIDSKSSKQYVDMATRLNRYIDIRDRKNWNARVTKLQDQLADKKINENQYLAELKKMATSARPGSQNVDDFANTVHDVERKIKDMKTATSHGGGRSSGGGGSSSTKNPYGTGTGAARAAVGDLNGPIPTFKTKTQASNYNKLVANRINDWTEVLRAKESGAGTVTLPAILFDSHAKPGETVTKTVSESLVATATKKALALYDRHITVDKKVGYDASTWTNKKRDFIVASSDLHTPSHQTVNQMIGTTMQIIENAGNNPDGAQGEADYWIALQKLKDFEKKQYKTSTVNPQVGFTITKDKNPALAANPQSDSMQAVHNLIGAMEGIANATSADDPILTANDTNRGIAKAFAATRAVREGALVPAVDAHGQPANVAPAQERDPVSGLILPRDKPNGGDTWVQATVPDGKGGARLAWVPANNMTINVPFLTTGGKELALADGTKVSGQLTTDQAAEIAKAKGMTLAQAIDGGLFGVDSRAVETSRVTIGGETYTRNPFTKSWIHGDNLVGPDVASKLFNTIPGVTVQGVGAIPYWTNLQNPELNPTRASGAGEAPIPEFSGVPKAAQDVYNQNAATIKMDARINGGRGFLRFDENGHPIQQSSTWETNSIFDPVVHARIQQETSAHSRDESGAADSEAEARAYQARIMRARLEAETADRNRKLAKISATFANDQRHGGFGTDLASQTAYDTKRALAGDIQTFVGKLGEAFGLGTLRKAGPPAPAEPDLTDDRRQGWMDLKPPSASRQVDPPATYSGPVLPGLTSMNSGITLGGQTRPKLGPALPTLKAPTMPSGKETKVVRPTIPTIKPPVSQAKANVTAQKVQNSGKSAKIGTTTKVAS